MKIYGTNNNQISFNANIEVIRLKSGWNGKIKRSVKNFITTEEQDSQIIKACIKLKNLSRPLSNPVELKPIQAILEKITNIKSKNKTAEKLFMGELDVILGDKGIKDGNVTYYVSGDTFNDRLWEATHKN